MGIKDLWTIITPYCERKPLYELEGKVVAIDLAGWVCESLNVVDYFVHPKQYLKNLFFRTCYLLLAGVTPVFVLEGKAPDLKQDTITKRNAIQFRGNRPRDESSQNSQPPNPGAKSKKGRSRFNSVLKECESLLQTMGLQCVQAPGEAEAYCAHLNMNGLVYGIISQDSDCFAYGAIRVFRNFSVSTQGNSAAAGGAVDIYDMEKIQKAMDFGQNKIVAMALLCGCDYSPGVEGIGRDAVVKLFAKYKNCEILERIKSWRVNDHKYTELEMKVDDKNICANCGHYGKALSHARNGCSLCRTSKSCNSSEWKEERLAIKSELNMRKKALLHANFPSEEIINEFLTHPETLPKLDLRWRQPNLVRFVKVIGTSLQWTEIYCFQKFLPLLTRWLVFNHGENCQEELVRGTIYPNFIKKKRAPKGIQSYEIVWKDDDRHFHGLIPDDQLKSYLNENPKGIESLFSTIEPVDATERAYPTIVQDFLSKQKKPKASKKKADSKPRTKKTVAPAPGNDSLNNMSDFLKATEEIERDLKKSKKKKKHDLPTIGRFFVHKSTPVKSRILCSDFGPNSSTPKRSGPLSLLDLEDDTDDFNYSDIIKNIISKPSDLRKYDGKRLKYDNVNYLNQSKDDLDLLPKKKRNFPTESPFRNPKRLMLADTHDSPLKLSVSQNDLNISSRKSEGVENLIDRFLIREGVSVNRRSTESKNVSYFFEKSIGGVDEFERSLDMHLSPSDEQSDSPISDDDCLVLD